MISKRIVIVLSVIFVLIAAGIVVWNQYKKKLLKDQVQKAVSNKTERLYAVGVGKLEVDEIAGNLEVTNLQLQPDSVVYNELVSTNSAPAMLISLVIPSLKVTGVKTPKALLENQIEGLGLGLK